MFIFSYSYGFLAIRRIYFGQHIFLSFHILEIKETEIFFQYLPSQFAKNIDYEKEKNAFFYGSLSSQGNYLIPRGKKITNKKQAKTH